MSLGKRKRSCAARAAVVLAGHLTDSAHGHGLLRVDTVRHDAERPPSSVGRVVALIPLECPAIASTDWDDFRLLGGCGEAISRPIPGVYCREDSVATWTADEPWRGET